jgi:nucleoid DNA-binding protein
MYEEDNQGKLTKKGITQYVLREAGTEQALKRQDALIVVTKTLDCITKALAQGQTVELRNFGIFDVVIRRPRVGRNPKNPKITVQIPARAQVRFRAGKEMEAAVARLDVE